MSCNSLSHSDKFISFQLFNRLFPFLIEFQSVVFIDCFRYHSERKPNRCYGKTHSSLQRGVAMVIANRTFDGDR